MTSLPSADAVGNITPSMIRQRLRRGWSADRAAAELPHVSKQAKSRRTISLTGMRFGKLMVVRRAGLGGRSGFATWLVRCDCGTEKILYGTQLRRGKTLSCGCDLSDRMSKLRRTHGEKGTPTWNSWMSMKQRCLREKDPSFHRYGARGIAVCERWLGSYEAFVQDMGHRPPGTTLDRYPDNSGDYEPGNCRWASTSAQARNRRSNRLLSYKGKTLLLCEWVQRTGLSKNAILERLGRGWTVEKTLSTPLKGPGRRTGPR